MKQIKLTNEMKIIFNTLQHFGYECFMVGGCVRDYLLGKKPNDIDFTTNASPQQMKECFVDYPVIETGIKHGTLTVIVNGKAFEITTYRTDGAYLDNRHPNSVSFVSDIKEDLARRDFTINAIAYNPSVGFVDCFAGMQDLKNHIIRCVNNPIERFNEDSLRILRALRFSATMDYEIEEKTKNACFKLAYLLKNISMERITSELFKTIVAPSGHKIIFDCIDIWGEVIPELLKMKDFQQHNPHHVHDVLKHTCVALEKATKNLIIRLTILFHDIGKPDTFTIDEKGNGHFYRHATKSMQITKEILDRLKVDNRTKEQVLTLIKYHDLDLQPTKKYIKKLCYKLGNLEMVKKLILVQRADNYGQAPLHTERIDKFNKIDEIVLQLEQENLSFSLKDLMISGNDLISLGLVGKEIGKSLKYLLNAVLNEQVENDKEQLLFFLKKNLGENNE